MKSTRLSWQGLNRRGCSRRAGRQDNAHPPPIARPARRAAIACGGGRISRRLRAGRLRQIGGPHVGVAALWRRWRCSGSISRARRHYSGFENDSSRQCGNGAIGSSTPSTEHAVRRIHHRPAGWGPLPNATTEQKIASGFTATRASTKKRVRPDEFVIRLTLTAPTALGQSGSA